jgi:hypothetical protein
MQQMQDVSKTCCRESADTSCGAFSRLSLNRISDMKLILILMVAGLIGALIFGAIWGGVWWAFQRGDKSGGRG